MASSVPFGQAIDPTRGDIKPEHQTGSCGISTGGQYGAEGALGYSEWLAFVELLGYSQFCSTLTPCCEVGISSPDLAKFCRTLLYVNCAITHVAHDPHNFITLIGAISAVAVLFAKNVFRLPRWDGIYIYAPGYPPTRHNGPFRDGDAYCAGRFVNIRAVVELAISNVLSNILKTNFR